MMTKDGETARMSGQPERDEPIDAEFEPAGHPPEPGPVVRKRGPGWLSSLAMMLLAAAGGGVLGYGTARYAPEWRGAPGFAALAAQQEARAGTLVALSERVEALEESRAGIPETAGAAARAALETQLAGLRTQIDARQEEDAGDRARLDRLARRVAMLESAGERDGASPEEVTRSLSALTGRVDALSQRLDGFGERIRSAETAGDDIAGQTDSLGARVASLEADLADLQKELDLIARQPPQTGSLGKAALALTQIEAAARRGQPFPAALSDLLAAMPEAGAVRRLAPIAQTGAPTLDMLAKRFPEMTAAVRGARGSDTGGGTPGLAGRIFGDAIEVRRDDEPSLTATLETAGTALESGDLGGAIAALETLDGDAADRAAPWLDEARSRRTLERSLDSLRLELMRQEP